MIIECPGVPLAVLDQQIMEAARKLAKDSEQWIETLEPTNLYAGKDTYTIDWTFCARIIRVNELRINDEAGVDAGRKAQAVNKEHWQFLPPDQIVLMPSTIPTVDVTRGLEIDVALAPEVGAWPWNDSDHAREFINGWFDGIVALAKSRLHRMPRKSWSDPQLAAIENQEYLSLLNLAKAETVRNYQLGDSIGA
jgi:hypothetical protein